MTADDMSAAEDRLRRRARQYLDAGLTDAAQITLEALVERVPDDASARMELANVLLGRGQLRAATRQLRHIAELPVGNVQLLVQTIRRLYFHGEIVAARSCLDRLERSPDPPAPLLAEQAQLRWMLGEIPAALTLIERATAAGVATPDACYLHAMLLQFNGDIARAHGLLETCLRRWPNFGDA